MRVLRDAFSHESSYTTPKATPGAGIENALRSMPGLVSRGSWYTEWKWTLTADGSRVIHVSAGGSHHNVSKSRRACTSSWPLLRWRRRLAGPLHRVGMRWKTPA